MAALHTLILTQSEALSSILAATLREDGIRETHQARTLRDALGLMRLYPIDFVICDRVVGGQQMENVLPLLRENATFGDFETILLTGDVDAGLQDICRQSGIDEVIIKPMSPRFIAERLAVRAGSARSRASANRPRVDWTCLPTSANVLPFAGPLDRSVRS